MINLSFEAVKGRSGNHDLPPVSVVVGDNFSGKSTILTALRLALLGYDPALGKTAAATWQLSSGPQMRVKLGQAPNGVRRSWTLERGSVKTATDIAGRWDIPAPLVDVRAFLGLPAKARADYILGMVPVPEAAVDEHVMLSAMPAPVDADVREFIASWSEDRRERGTAPGEWLASILEEAKRKAKDAAGAAVEAEATVRRLLVPTDATVRGLADQSGAIEAAEDRVARLQAAEATARKAAEYAQAARSATLALQATEDSLAAARTRLGAMADVPRAAYDAAAGWLAELRPRLHNETVTWEAATAQRRKLGASGKCPLCGCKAKELADKLDAEIATAKAAIEKLTAEIADNQKVLDNWNAAEGAKCQVAVLVGQVEAARKRVAELPSAPETSEEDAITELVTAREQLSILRAEQRKHEAAQGRRAMLAKAESDAVAARQQAETWAGVAKALKLVREKAVAEAFGSFAGRISQFTDGILGFDLLVRDGEIGYMADGIWVSHEVMSGSEMAIVYAGLGVALAGTATVKIVMMDEVLLDDDTKHKVAMRMLDLSAQGIIDAAVFVDVTDHGWPTLCNIIKV